LAQLRSATGAHATCLLTACPKQGQWQWQESIEAEGEAHWMGQELLFWLAIWVICLAIAFY